MITGQKDYVTPKQGLIFKYEGKFDLKKLYSSSKEWFKKNNYFFTEKEYKEKPVENGREFKIVMEGERDIDDYTKFFISVIIFITNFRKVGDKNTGSIKVNLSSYVLLDRENRWQSNSFKAFLFFFYNNLILKNKISNVYEDKLYGEVLDFANNLKKNIDIK